MLKSPRSQQHLYMNTQGLCMNATGVLGFSNYATVCILIPCKQKNYLKKMRLHSARSQFCLFCRTMETV